LPLSRSCLSLAIKAPWDCVPASAGRHSATKAGNARGDEETVETVKAESQPEQDGQNVHDDLLLKVNAEADPGAPRMDRSKDDYIDLMCRQRCLRTSLPTVGIEA
jgi:hypothetical protein